MINVIVVIYALLLTIGETSPMSLTAQEHPWGCFKPKTWCVVQITITSNVNGQTIRSVQTIKTTLESIDESGITLQELESVEFGGKTVEKKSQLVKFDFFQEPIQKNVNIRQGTPVKLMIEKKTVPCEVRIYEQQTAGGRLVTTVWYTAQVYPYVLRVEKILWSTPNNETSEERIISQSVTSVQETMAFKNRSSNRHKTYRLQKTEKTGSITKITEYHCSKAMPGGLLYSTTREFDAQNNEIRSSVSRITNYFYISMPNIPQSHRSWTSGETD